MKTHIIATILILVVFAACGSENNTSVETGWAAELRLEQDELLSKFEFQPYVRERDGLIRSEAFDDYFEPVGLIELSTEELLSSPGRMDVDSDGRLLVSDAMTNKVYLFGSDGSLITQLNTEECHPGFPWFPMDALFSPNGDILVFINGPTPVFKFGNKGECIGVVNLGGIHPRSHALGSSEIYSYSLGLEDWKIQSIDSVGVGKIIVSGTDFIHYNMRMGGMTSDIALFGGHTIGLSQRQSPFVRLFSTVDGSETQIGTQPDYYKPIVEDMKPGATGMENIMDEMKKVSEGKSITVGFYSVSDELAMLVYRNQYVNSKDAKDTFGLQVVRTDGEVIHDEPITLGPGIGLWSTSNGLLFQLTSEYDKGPDGFDKNSPIVVYRFRPGGAK